MAKEQQQVGFGVIGLGQFGATLSKALADAGQDVLVLDIDEEKIRSARAYTDAAYVIDKLDRETLTEVGIQNCDTVIVGIGEQIDTSILTTLILKQLGIRRVIAKAITDDQGTVLEKLGAEVVFPESDMALRLAKKLTTKQMLDFLTIAGDVEVSELQLTHAYAGKTVAEANFRGKFGLNIMAVCGEGGISTDIRPDHMLREGDIIVVIGKKENVERFEQLLSKE